MKFFALAFGAFAALHLMMTISLSEGGVIPRNISGGNHTLRNNSKDNRFDGESFVKILSLNASKNFILKQNTQMGQKNFFGFLIVPYIICFFAAKGFWPLFPAMLQYQVDEMGKKIFALSDDRIRQFCRGKFDFPDTCYRPGYFLPIAIDPSCATTTTTTTTTPPPTPEPPMPTICVPVPAPTAAAAPIKETEAPVITVATKKPDTVETFPPTKTIPPATLEELGENANINIEIHNVFGFGKHSANHTKSVARAH